MRLRALLVTAALLSLAFLTAAGCCGAATSDAAQAVAADNVAGWKLAQAYADAAGWPDLDGLAGQDPDPKKPSWSRRFQAWRANAAMSQAAAAGNKDLDYKDAYAAAAAVDSP